MDLRSLRKFDRRNPWRGGAAALRHKKTVARLFPSFHNLFHRKEGIHRLARASGIGVAGVAPARKVLPPLLAQGHGFRSYRHPLLFKTMAGLPTTPTTLEPTLNSLPVTCVYQECQVDVRIDWPAADGPAPLKRSCAKCERRFLVDEWDGVSAFPFG